MCQRAKQADRDWSRRVLLPITQAAKQIWFSFKECLFLIRNRTRDGRFATIYHDDLWGNPESASGYGSTADATATTRAGLESLIQQYGVATLLDAPCGDFNWMRQVRFDGTYIGCDIVPKLVARNENVYGNARRSFCRLDICEDQLPKSDLVLCRECLNHLSFAEISSALFNLERATKVLLVITHYPAITQNRDQVASFRFRPLNLTLPPFSLRAPDSLIDEGSFETGKTLGVWDFRRGSLASPS